MVTVDPRWREAVLLPPLETDALPGIGGRTRSRDEDFFVEEIPAYAPDGVRGAFLFVQIEKRGIDTPHAVRELCRQLELAPSLVGFAGRKDRRAVTRQWLSIPSSSEERLGEFRHPQIDILQVEAHSQKLRRGHNLGNRFQIVVRDLAGDPEQLVETTRAKFRALARGVLNAFGPQRFGREGANLEAGLRLLQAGRRRSPNLFLLSAGQSVLFNSHLARRVERGIVDRLLGGELVRRTDTGGMFTADDVEVDGARLDAGDLVITGPMFGSKMRSPRVDSSAAEFEREDLEIAGIEPEAIRSFGKKLPGTRRPLRATIAAGMAQAVEADGSLSAGLQLSFALPSGSYATQVLREVQFGGGVEPSDGNATQEEEAP